MASPVRQGDGELLGGERGAAVGDMLDARSSGIEALRPIDGGVEAGEPVQHRLPVGDLRIGLDEEGERALHLTEGGGDLHQAAEHHGAGEIERAHDDERENDGDLRVAGGQECQPLGPLHDAVPIADDAGKAVAKPLLLRRLAGEQRHLLGVLAQAHQREAEIGFIALLVEIEFDQRMADEMRHPGADDGVDQRRPDQIAGNVEGLRADHQRKGRRQAPQDHHEGDQRDDGAEERDADVEGRIDEEPDVVGDALIGIVGEISLEAHAVMRAVAEPTADIAAGEPAPPPDLQPLLQVELIDGADDEGGGQQAEDTELPDEDVPVLVLQRVVESLVPGVEADIQPDLEQLERDHRREQNLPGPPSSERK